MRSLTSSAVLAAVMFSSLVATAETQTEIAIRNNEEGKELMFAQKYAEASAKFREAVARVPEAKYFFNLCTSLFQEGKFGEAKTACSAVEKNNPTPELAGKAAKLTGKIDDEAKSQGLPAVAVGGGGIPDQPPPPETCQTNPSAPECQPQQPPPQQQMVVGRPPSGTGVFAGTKAGDNKYIWTVGGNFFGGGGTIGREGFYGNTAVGFELHGNYLFNPQQRIGAQAYVQYAQFAPGEDQSGNELNLISVDLGVGLYKHLCPRGTERLCLTPMIGAHLALYSPEFDQFDGEAQFNYAAAGVRAELGLEYAFGSRMEHVLSLKAGFNGYSSVFSDPGTNDFGDDVSARAAGLDTTSGYGYFGIGYTHRFSTPLGSSPFVTLE